MYKIILPRQNGFVRCSKVDMNNLMPLSQRSYNITGLRGKADNRIYLIRIYKFIDNRCGFSCLKSIVFND